MRNDKKVLLFCVVFSALVGCSTRRVTTDFPPLRTVPYVDLKKYLGTWYEIASFPQYFQRNCTGTTATYSLKTDGEIDVINHCKKGSLDGKDSIAKGRARVVDSQTNAKLEVSFFRSVWGDYWIIDLGEKYEFAVIGDPKRNYLWILSRTPIMKEATYLQILNRLQAQNYDTSRLVRTLQ